MNNNWRSLDDAAFQDDSGATKELPPPPPINSIADFRQKVESAIKEGREELTAIYRAEANKILEAIPAICKNAILQKKKSACVMTLTRDHLRTDWKNGRAVNVPANAAKIVFEMCEKVDLFPVVKGDFGGTTYMEITIKDE
jgi:hypothetical protein